MNTATMTHAAERQPRIAASTEKILTISAAGKTYANGGAVPSPALLPVTESIRAGEFVSFVGPSGCGKTTLLKMCAGLLKPSAGQIDFKQTAHPIQPGNYGFVFQAAALLPWRNVLANVMLGADLLHMPAAGARKRATALLNMVHLGQAADRYPNQLSGGMQQRVSIARALLHDPEILFMDEPFGALDAMTREQLNMELQRISLEQAKTVLFVTHDIEEAVLLSDRIFVFTRGPGRLISTLEVNIPRPRTLADKADPEFQQTVAQIRRLLEQSAPTGEAKP